MPYLGGSLYHHGSKGLKATVFGRDAFDHSLNSRLIADIATDEPLDPVRGTLREPMRCFEPQKCPESGRRALETTLG